MSKNTTIEEVAFEVERTQTFIDLMESTHNCCEFHATLALRFSQPMKVYKAEMEAKLSKMVIDKAKVH